MLFRTSQHIPLALLYLLAIQDGCRCRGKMIRNSALMNQMVNHFHRENNLSLDSQTQSLTTRRPKQHRPQPSSQQKPDKVMAMMKSVLCNNFPSIPCNIITQDPTLNKLISRSIHQISKKQNTLARGFVLDRMTNDKEKDRNEKDQSVAQKTKEENNSQSQAFAPPKDNVYRVINNEKEKVYHVVNSEDLSSFLAVQHTGYFKQRVPKQKRKPKKTARNQVRTVKNYWSHEKKPKKDMKEAKHTNVYTGTGRKKLRKFYPHKMKDKGKKHGQFVEYSDEKLSISVEVPDVKMPTKNEPMVFKVEPSESPVWRIDSMKHGVPNLNMFGYEDETLMGKLMKNGRNTENNVIANENGLVTPRKDVMHPDLYIKKNFARKNTNTNSDGLDK